MRYKVPALIVQRGHLLLWHNKNGSLAFQRLPLVYLLARVVISDYYCPLNIESQKNKNGLIPFCGVSPNCYLCFCYKTSIT